MQSFYGKEMSNYDSENRYIEMTIPLTDTGTKDVVGVMLVSVSTDSILSNLDYLKTSILTNTGDQRAGDPGGSGISGRTSDQTVS